MEIDTIKNWANQNQGFLAIILFLASLIIGWISGIFKWIFNQVKGNTSVINTGGNISAGGDIVVGQRVGKDNKKAGIILEGKNALLVN